MNKGNRIKEMLADTALRVKTSKLKDRYLVMLSGAYLESENEFKKLEGLTWPQGEAILISIDKRKIENSSSSAQINPIPNTPYFAEVGHSKTDLKKLAELAFRKMGYPPGLLNQIKDFIEPLTGEELTLKYTF
jgi:negative regulator of replication initiation